MTDTTIIVLSGTESNCNDGIPYTAKFSWTGVSPSNAL